MRSTAIGKKSASPGPRRCVEPWQLPSPRSHGWGLTFAAIQPSEAVRAFERKIPLNSCGGFGRSGSRVTACVDSDVLIDYFDGIPAAADELSRYGGLVISRNQLDGGPYGCSVGRPPQR